MLTESQHGNCCVARLFYKEGGVFRKFSERKREYPPLCLSPFEEPIATPTLHYKHPCWLSYEPERDFLPLLTRKSLLFITDLESRP